MKIGKVISAIRKSKSVSQGDLAKLCDITQAYLSQIENDKKEPNLSVLKSISKHLDTPLPIIFFKSLSEEDVPNHKKDVFNTVNASLNQLVDSIFFETYSESK